MTCVVAVPLTVPRRVKLMILRLNITFGSREHTHYSWRLGARANLLAQRYSCPRINASPRQRTRDDASVCNSDIRYMHHPHIVRRSSSTGARRRGSEYSRVLAPSVWREDQLHLARQSVARRPLPARSLERARRARNERDACVHIQGLGASFARPRARARSKVVARCVDVTRASARRGRPSARGFRAAMIIAFD